LLIRTGQILDDSIANKWKTEAIGAARATLRSEEYDEDSAEGEAETNTEDSDVSPRQQDEAENDYANLDDDDPRRFARWPIHYVPRDESMMTAAMADYCIAELRHKAKGFEDSPSGAIFVFNGDVVKSDKAVSLETKKALQMAVEPLENVPEKRKDWHPGSDERVLDLVHPSLFPLIYGRSRVLAVGEKVTSLEDFARRSGEGDVVPVPDQPGEQSVGRRWRRQHFSPYSDKFQWLPCDVDITGDKPRYVRQ
jgi:Protein of unknown function (DUF4246)